MILLSRSKRWITICVILHQLSLAFGQSSRYDCPGGWDTYEENCYRFVRGPRLNHDRAGENCRRDGAALISISSDGEHAFVTRTFDSIDPGPGRLTWLTSGRRNPTRPWSFFWEGTGDEIQRHQYWINETIRQRPSPYNHVCYYYDGNKWGWILGIASEERAFICEISKRDIWKILDEQRDHSFGVLNPDINTLPRGPEFIIEPENTIFFEDTPEKIVRMICSVDAFPYSSYTWQKDNVDITHRSDPRYTFTNGELAISNPTRDRDAGRYQCAAQNEGGKIFSRPAFLNFGYLHDFSTQVRNPVQVDAWQGSAIDCYPPDHYPTIMFDWFKDNTDNFVRKEYTFVSWDSRLWFQYATQDDIGLYYCMVYQRAGGTNRGRTSMPVHLQVNQAVTPVIEPTFATGFPQSFPGSPKRGDYVRLECFSQGTGKHIYRWDRIGGEMPQNAEFRERNRVLILPMIQLEEAGEYKCTVRREFGQSISDVVQIVLQSEPYFTLPLENQHLDIGTNLIWRCEANGVPSPSYRWYRNGVLLTQETLPPDMAGRATVNNNVLTINDVRLSDAEMYQCGAENVHGTLYSTAQVRVLEFAPTFAKLELQPRQFATQGGTTTIYCSPEAAPRPEIRWFRDRTELHPSPDENARVRKLPNGHLMIRDIGRGDMGNYTCIATNSQGTASSTGELVILTRSTIPTGPMGLQVVENMTSYLHCEASVNRKLDFTYIWKHNDIRINLEKEWKEFARYNGTYRGGLFIKRTKIHHQGTYTCMVETQVDSVESKAELTVIGPPMQPTGVKVDQITATSIRVSFYSGFPNGRPITSHVIEALNYHLNYWAVVKTNVRCIYDPKVRCVTTVTGLSPWSRYRFRARSENELGTGEPSTQSVEITTSSTAPMQVPGNIRQGWGKVGTLEIVWDPLKPNEFNGPGIGYKVEWMDLQQSQSNESAIIMGTAKKYTHTIGEDLFYLLYNVSVTAFNDIGMGPKGEWVTIYSAEHIPTVMPVDLRAIQYNSTALYVCWQHIEPGRDTTRGRILGYGINYWIEGKETEEMSIQQNLYGQMDCGMIIGLWPFTNYWTNVQVFNSAGYGPKSANFKQRTLRKAPVEYPEEVNFAVLNNTALKVWWRGVMTDQTQEPVEGYKMKYWRDSQHVRSALEVDAGRHVEGILANLSPGIRYNLRVSAYSRGGDGAMSGPTITFFMSGSSKLHHSPTIYVWTLTAIWTIVHTIF
ncbi:unnamed protein product [Owenia fusiformis]|uniref:Contactin n=1 Tax=Owenia fusiformis TaxID=6347 RepID=A0A8S4NN77_OWEFU|nr:unnamed protein product [Owenia fusiformis]